MPRRSWATVAVLFVLGCGAGDDGPGPDPSPGSAVPLAIGDTVTGRVAVGDTVRLIYVATGSDELALFFAVDSGQGLLEYLIVPAGSGGGLVAAPGNPSALLLNRTERLPLQAGDTLRVGIWPRPEASDTRYRLLAYRVDRRPEHSPEAYQVDSLRSTERLETSADIDEFVISAADSLELVGVLRTPDASVGGTAGLFLNPPSFNGLGAVPGSESIEQAATRTVAVPPGPTTVQVVGNGGPPQPYEFRVRRVRRAPEVAPAEITAGRSTFGEAIEHIGDIDEYTIVGPLGQYTNLYLSATPSERRTLWVTTLGDGVASKEAYAFSGRPEASTGRVEFPASGRVKLRVYAAGAVPESMGPYQIMQDLLNPAVENGSTLVLGDSVIAESVERQGDIDTLAFSLPAPAALNLFLRRVSGTPGDLQLDVWPAGDSASAMRLLLWASRTTAGTGPIRLAAGNYVARVMGADGHREPALFTGPYRLHAYRIDSAPEIAPVAASVGSVLQDAIDPPGDRDTFALAIQAGDVVRLRLSGIVPNSPIGASILNRTPGAAPAWMGAAGVPVIVGPATSQPIEFGVAGPHRIEVKSVEEGLLLNGPEGPYTLTIEPVPLTPESNPASLGVNATVSEALDAGDIDEYTVVGAVGQEVAFYLSGSSVPACAEFMDPGSPVRRGGTAVGPNGEGSGPVALGASGSIRVRVWAAIGCPTQPFSRYGSLGTGSYGLAVRLVDLAPETAAASLATSDTVGTESIDHPADADVFTFAGVAGSQVLPAVWQAPQPSLLQMNLRLTVTAPGGVTVAEVQSQRVVNRWLRGSPVSLPVTGTYTVRLEVDNRREGAGAYRFTLQP